MSLIVKEAHKWSGRNAIAKNTDTHHIDVPYQILKFLADFKAKNGDEIC